MTKKSAKDNKEKDPKVSETSKVKETKEKSSKKAGKKEKKLSKAEEFEQKYNNINDKYLRLTAEFDNFRKRSLKEKMELVKSAGEDILINILPVMDNFERAMSSMGDE